MTDAHKPLPELIEKDEGLSVHIQCTNPNCQKVYLLLHKTENTCYSCGAPLLKLKWYREDSVENYKKALAQRLKDIISKRMLIERELCLELEQLIKELEGEQK